MFYLLKCFMRLVITIETWDEMNFVVSTVPADGLAPLVYVRVPYVYRASTWRITNTILWTVPFVTLCLICNFTWRLLYFTRLLQSFWLILLLTKSFCKINFTIESTCYFVISTVPADGLTPNGARPSVSTVMSKCRYHIFRDSAHEKLPCYGQTHSSHMINCKIDSIMITVKPLV